MSRPAKKKWGHIMAPFLGPRRLPRQRPGGPKCGPVFSFLVRQMLRIGPRHVAPWPGLEPPRIPDKISVYSMVQRAPSVQRCSLGPKAPGDAAACIRDRTASYLGPKALISSRKRLRDHTASYLDPIVKWPGWFCESLCMPAWMRIRTSVDLSYMPCV